MTTRLPDVALTEPSARDMPLSWVGMDDICLPLMLEEKGIGAPVSASAAVAVNLPRGEVKGIHMSRLHALLDNFSAIDTVNAASVDALLSSMIESHRDCGTTAARLRFAASVLRRRDALRTADVGGWRRYPFHVEAEKNGAHFRLSIGVRVLYSSTCPCSAALVRQHLRETFLTEHGNAAQLTPDLVADWLSRNATAATPHSQRSEADVEVAIPHGRSGLELFALIDRIEDAVATPVQTAVKRADEQAFARLNGQNLMYVEDAVRRISAALQPEFPECSVEVRHLESLHAHDAVAAIGEDVGKEWRHGR